MRTSNLVIFFVLLLAIMFGWPLLMNRLWPPKPKPPIAEEYARYARLWTASYPAGSPLENACRVATEMRLARLTPKELSELTALAKKAEPPAQAKVENKPKPRPKPPGRKPVDIQLGDDSSNLKVTFNSRGAG